jgi:hypothetical protein
VPCPARPPGEPAHRLTALAQLRTAVIQSALALGAVLPAAPPVGPDTASRTEEITVNPADLQIWTGDAPLPANGGQPCPAAPNHLQTNTKHAGGCDLRSPYRNHERRRLGW